MLNEFNNNQNCVQSITSLKIFDGNQIRYFDVNTEVIVTY